MSRQNGDEVMLQDENYVADWRESLVAPRQHDSRRSARLAGKQTRTDTFGIEAGFVLSAQRFGANLSRLEIRLDFRGSSQIVADNVVNIGKIERRVLLNDFFGGSAVAKSTHYGV